MVRPHRDTDFSKLVNVCPVKTFSLISTCQSIFSQNTPSLMFDKQKRCVLFFTRINLVMRVLVCAHQLQASNEKDCQT